jgi:hypothetical protein
VLSPRPTPNTRALSAILGVVVLLGAAVAALYGVVIAQS